jgi:hypothetical protein
MMGVQYQLLEHRLAAALEQAARPYGCDEGLTLEVQTGLWRLGVPCSELTPREELVVRLWARKRSLSAVGDISGAAPPPAA